MGDNDIRNNFVYLTENMGNLHGILIRLLQDRTISRNEKEQIENKNTSSEKNDKLLTLIEGKIVRGRFLEILRQTNNEHCADELEKAKAAIEPANKKFKHSEVRKCEKIGKWWPDKKQLIEALHKRKFGDKFLVEELHDRIKKDKNRMVAICESPDAGKYSGMGGIGKTLTATWYAHHYEEFYDHILWIDCGEGSLLKSFKKLASDLNLSIKKEFEDDVEELGRKCFQDLSNFTCLWIYDNAEGYHEKEGIKHVLPKFKNEFYCLITSRSREWGTETGYGKISDLQLEIFSQVDSIEFLEKHLRKEIKCTDYDLRELCRLLGNLPLALQLAVAALNKSKMDVKTYIEKSKFVKVLDSKFDDYEKTINGNVKVSLDLIEKEENGTTCKEILMIFGYIRPDGIPLEFFKSALQIEDDRKIKESFKLLKKYSLIAKTKTINDDDEKEIYFSIHRLLQQVIRHNEQKKEKEILRKILGCDGFIDHKLLPFTKYADEELRKEFPKVKAELLDQQQLRKLFWEKRFEECVQLAKFIDQELQRNATKFNYAICLHENGQVEECVKTAEGLLHLIPLTGHENNFSKALNKMVEYLKRINFRVDVQREWWLMDLKREDNEKLRQLRVKLRQEIGSLLLFSYLRLGKFDDAIAIGRRTANKDQIFRIITQMMKDKKLSECVQLAKFIHQEINTNTTKLNYAICLDRNGQVEESVNTLEELHQQEMKEEVDYSMPDVEMGLLKLDKEVSRVLVGGHLMLVYFKKDDKRKAKEILEKKYFKINYSEENLGILVRLVYPHLIHSNYFIRSNLRFIDLNLDVETKTIQLHGCSLSLNSFDRLSPEELTLEGVSFFRDGQKLKEVTVNNFLDLLKIKRLTLQSKSSTEMSLDLSGFVCMEYLELVYVRVLNWSNSNWNVKELKLSGIPFVEKTNIIVQEMTFSRSSCDVSCLPQTIRKLTLGGVVKVFVSGGVELPNLNYLTLNWMEDVGCLTHFRSATLTHMHLNLIAGEVDVDLLPQTLTHLKINKSVGTRVVGGARKVDKLILEWFFFEGVEECLSHLQTHNLVIYYPGIEAKELVQLMDREIKTIAVGGIEWAKEDFKNYSSQLDTEAIYYFLQGGRGRALEQEDFNKRMNLNE